MPDNADQAAATAAKDAGATPPPSGQGSGTPPPPPPDAKPDDDLGEGGQKALAAERKSAKEALKRATDAEAALKKLQDDQLSDAEKQTKRLAELERANADLLAGQKAERLRSVVISTAVRLGFANPEHAARLLDPGDVEYDGNGAPTNVDPLLTALLKENPNYASAAAKASGSMDQGARGASTLTMEEIRKMTPEEVNQRWDEVQGVLSKK